MEGLEPPTPGFGDRCSSQLSYTPSAARLSVAPRQALAQGRERVSDATGLARSAFADNGAGEGNRTLVISLEGCCSTIELHPRRGQ